MKTSSNIAFAAVGNSFACLFSEIQYLVVRLLCSIFPHHAHFNLYNGSGREGDSLADNDDTKEKIK